MLRMTNRQFPSCPIANPERESGKGYAGGPIEQIAERTYEHRVPWSVRISEPAQDPTPWLRESYINSAGQMICQMPVREANAV